MLIRKIKFIPFYIISILPLTILYRLSGLAYIVLYHILKYRRNIVYYNLRSSFPAKSESEIKQTEKDFYKHFCDVAFETIKALTISESDLKKRFRIKNPDIIESCFKNDMSIILYGAHFANWEWLPFISLFVPHKVIALYRPLKNKYFNDLIKIIRERFGATCIKSGSGYREIVRQKRNFIKTISIIVGDQSPKKNSNKYRTDFLLRKTAFLKGADRIARKHNQVVLYPETIKLKRGYYEIRFEILYDNFCMTGEPHIIEKYAACLEKNIREAPELWLWRP